MLSTIKTILKDTATAKGLNFIFSSFKEMNSKVEDVDLSISTIVVNSIISVDEKKTPGNVFVQGYKIHLACIRKREVEVDDEEIFDNVIVPCEIDLLSYLNTVSESLLLIEDLGDIKKSPVYFLTATPTAGLSAEFKMTTNCLL